MTRDEWQGIARIAAAAAWPDAGHAERTEVYFELLRDLDAEKVRRAVESLVREPREQLPAPGVIRARAAAHEMPAAHETREPPTVARLTSAHALLQQSGFAAGAVLAAVALASTWLPFAGGYSLWELGDQNIGLRLQAIVLPTVLLACSVLGLLGSLLRWPTSLASALAAVVAAGGGMVAGPALFFLSLPDGVVDASLGGGVEWGAALLAAVAGLLIAAGVGATGFRSWTTRFSTQLSGLLPMAIIGMTATTVASVSTTKTWWEFDSFEGPTGFDIRVGKVVLGLVIAAAIILLAAALIDLIGTRRISPSLHSGAAALYGVSCGGLLASASSIEPLLFTMDQGFADDVLTAPWLVAGISVTAAAVLAVLVAVAILAWEPARGDHR